MNTHRNRTRRATRSWQLAALALAGGAAALGFSPLAKYLSPKPFVQPKGPEVAQGPMNTSRALPASETSLLALAMNTRAGKVAVAPPPPPPEKTDDVAVGGDETTHVEPPKPPPSEWTYKSYLGSPGLKAATVQVDDHQMLVCQGRTYENIKVVEVLPTHLTIEEGGVQKRLDIAARVSNGFPTDGPARPMAAMGRPGQAGMPPNFNQPNNAKGMASAFHNNNNNGNPNGGLDQQRRANMQPVPQFNQPQAGTPVMEDAKAKYENLSAEKRDMLTKIITDSNVDPQKRMSMLEEMGLSPKASPEDRINFMQMMGVTPDSDPKFYETLKGGGK